jgi:hypothetical protein
MKEGKLICAGTWRAKRPREAGRRAVVIKAEAGKKYDDFQLAYARICCTERARWRRLEKPTHQPAVAVGAALKPVVARYVAGDGRFDRSCWLLRIRGRPSQFAKIPK